MRRLDSRRCQIGLFRPRSFAEWLVPTVPVSRLRLGHGFRRDIHQRRQTPRPLDARLKDGSQRVAPMQGSSDSPRTSDIRSSSGPSHTPSFALSPARSQQVLPLGGTLPVVLHCQHNLFGIYVGSPLWSLPTACSRFGLSSKTKF